MTFLDGPTREQAAAAQKEIEYRLGVYDQLVSRQVMELNQAVVNADEELRRNLFNKDRYPEAEREYVNALIRFHETIGRIMDRSEQC